MIENYQYLILILFYLPSLLSELDKIIIILHHELVN